MGLNGLNPAQEPPKGMPYVAQVKKDGKVIQEIKFFDTKNEAGELKPDGIFSDKEMYSVMNYYTDQSGKEIAEEYVDEDQNGTVDFVNLYTKKDDKYVQVARVEENENGNMQIKEKSMDKLSKEDDKSKRPNIFDVAKRAYDVLIKPGVVARYADNNDGKLEENELHIIQKKTESKEGVQIVTEYVDSIPLDGTCDYEHRLVLVDGKWEELGPKIPNNEKMTDIRDK